MEELLSESGELIIFCYAFAATHPISAQPAAPGPSGLNLRARPVTDRPPVVTGPGQPHVVLPLPATVPQPAGGGGGAASLGAAPFPAQTDWAETAQ